MKIKIRKASTELDFTNTIAWDVESTGLRPYHGDRPFAVSMCDVHGNTRFWDWPVDPFTRKVDYTANSGAVDQVSAILTDPSIIKVGHNHKFDARMVEVAWGVHIAGELHETMFAARVWNSQEPSLKLKLLAEKYLDYPKDDETALQKAVVSARAKGRKLGWNLGEKTEQDYWTPKAFDSLNALCEQYAIGDVERTICLHLLFQKKLLEDGLMAVYEREMRLWYTVYKMESRGVRLHRKQARIELADCKDRALKEKHKLFAIVGYEFNPNSDQQVSRICFDERKLVVDKQTAGGKPSTGWKSLIIHVSDPFVRALFDYRAADHGIGFFEQYLDLSTPDALNPGGFVLRSSFEQSSASTGRFGSRQPNLQNVPTRSNPTGAIPPAARRPFGPRPGYVWYAFDYSQLEFRIMADCSQDPNMLAAISSGRDVHSEVADIAWGSSNNPAAIVAAINALEIEHYATNNSLVEATWLSLHVKPNEHRSSMDNSFIARSWLESFNWSIVQAEASVGKKNSRDTAKTVMYAKMYGGGATAVVAQLRCPLDTAKSILDDINTKFPGIKQYSYAAANFGRNHGYIVNAYGRKCQVDTDFAYRAVNYVIQGGAADLIKHAMIRCDDYLVSLGIDAHLVLTIHDELVFEFAVGQNKLAYLRTLKRTMEDHGNRFGVPLPVECSRITSSWDKKVKMEI